MASAKKTAKSTAAQKKGKGADAAKPQTGVDDPDALMATTLRAMEWASKNKKRIAYSTLGAAGIVGVAFLWFSWRTGREEKASDLVAQGVSAELAPLKQGDEDPETLKRLQFYASEDEKQKAALADYAEARNKYGDTGPGILARLGEAGVHLDRHEWDDAIAGYTDVRNTSFAAADGNVRMRCIEGIGYAREGKGQIDDARRAFDELSNLEVVGAKPLGLYHLARLDLVQNQKDPALNKLKSAHEFLLNNPLVSARYLKDQVEKLMQKIDPSSVPKQPPMPGGFNGMQGPDGQQIDPETLQKLLDSMKQQQGGAVPPQPVPPEPAPAPKGS
jgi:hypothetical protein